MGQRGPARTCLTDSSRNPAGFRKTSGATSHPRHLWEVTSWFSRRNTTFGFLSRCSGSRNNDRGPRRWWRQLTKWGRGAPRMPVLTLPVLQSSWRLTRHPARPCPPHLPSSGVPSTPYGGFSPRCRHPGSLGLRQSGERRVSLKSPSGCTWPSVWVDPGVSQSLGLLAPRFPRLLAFMLRQRGGGAALTPAPSAPKKMGSFLPRFHRPHFPGGSGGSCPGRMPSAEPSAVCSPQSTPARRRPQPPVSMTAHMPPSAPAAVLAEDPRVWDPCRLFPWPPPPVPATLSLRK